MSERGGCMNWLGVALIVVVVLVVWASWGAIQDAGASIAKSVAEFVDTLLTVGLWLAVGCVVVVFGLVTLPRINATMNGRNNRLRQQDGAYALVERRVRLVDGTRATVLVDPNRLVGPGALVTDDGQMVDLARRDLVEEYMMLAAQRNRVASVQALAPGDRALENLHIPYRPNFVGSQRLLREEPQAPQRALPAPPPLPPAQLLTLKSAVTLASTAEEWTVGQDPASGARAILRPYEDNSFGVVGAPGSGKTWGVAGTIIACALHSGRVGVSVWDGKGGLDWKRWASHVEWHPVDGSNFADCVRAMHADLLRRMDLLALNNASTVDELPAKLGVRHHLHAIEEFGVLLTWLRRDRATAREVEGLLDDIWMRGRAAGVHILVIDQYPDRWSGSAMAGSGAWLAVHKLGPNQGTIAGQYGAQNLTERGDFMLRGAKFHSWDVRPRLEKMLGDLPPSGAPRIIEGEFRVVGGQNLQNLQNGAAAWTEPERTGQRTDRTTGRAGGTEPTELTEPAELTELPPTADGGIPTPQPTEQVRRAPVAERIVWCIEWWEETYNRRPRQVEVLATMEACGWSSVKSYVRLRWREYYGLGPETA